MHDFSLIVIKLCLFCVAEVASSLGDGAHMER